MFSPTQVFCFLGCLPFSLKGYISLIDQNDYSNNAQLQFEKNSASNMLVLNFNTRDWIHYRLGWKRKEFSYGDLKISNSWKYEWTAAANSLGKEVGELLVEACWE